MEQSNVTIFQSSLIWPESICDAKLNNFLNSLIRVWTISKNMSSKITMAIYNSSSISELFRFCNQEKAKKWQEKFYI